MASTSTATVSASPSILITTKSAAIELNGTLTGGKGNGTVQWQTDHNYSGTATLTDSGSWTSTSIPLVTGVNTITVLAYDAADQVTTKTAIVTLQSANATATTSSSSPTTAVRNAGPSPSPSAMATKSLFPPVSPAANRS